MCLVEMMNTAWAQEYMINTTSRRDDRGIEWMHISENSTIANFLLFFNAAEIIFSFLNERRK